jgi:hypothetical protein
MSSVIWLYGLIIHRTLSLNQERKMLSYTEWLRWRDEKIRLLERSTGENKWKKLKGINDDVMRKISWKSNTARDSLWMAYEGAQWSYFVRTLFS